MSRNTRSRGKLEVAVELPAPTRLRGRKVPTTTQDAVDAEIPINQPVIPKGKGNKAGSKKLKPNDNVEENPRDAGQASKSSKRSHGKPPGVRKHPDGGITTEGTTDVTDGNVANALNEAFAPTKKPRPQPRRLPPPSPTAPARPAYDGDMSRRPQRSPLAPPLAPSPPTPSPPTPSPPGSASPSPSNDDRHRQGKPPVVPPGGVLEAIIKEQRAAVRERKERHGDRSPALESDLSGSDWEEDIRAQNKGELPAEDEEDHDDNMAVDEDEPPTTKRVDKGKKRATSEGDHAKGRIPRECILEVVAAHNEMVEEVGRIAEKWNRDPAKLMKYVEVSASGESSDWNKFQSFYNHFNPKEDSEYADMPVPEYTRTIVGPAYHAMMALPASEREREMQLVCDWYEKATTNSVSDMHRTGQIGKQVEKIAFQYTQLGRHDYELYDIHSFGYIFALSQTKKGVPIRQVWSGTPLLPDVLKSGWTANWQHHLHAVESLLVTQREKSLAAEQQKTRKPPPYLWLLDVDFTIHGRQSERDMHRRVLSELGVVMYNVIQRERNPVDPALVKGMPWATWDSSAYQEQMVILNWPAGFLHPGSQSSGYKVRYALLKHVSKVVEPWIRCKDRELYDHEYSQLFAIRPWSQRARDLPLASQGRIPLVIDTNGTVLLRVEDCEQYAEDLSKEPEGESSTAPGSILEDDEDESVFYVPLPLPPHLDPNQPEAEWDYKDLPQAGPSRLPLQSEASTSRQALSTHPQLCGPAVRPDGTLRDAGEIDFSEDVEVPLPSTPPPARLVTPRSPPSVPPPKRRKGAKVHSPQRKTQSRRRRR